jgi:hypothetical protein
MKTLWNCSNYGNDLKLTSGDAAACNHSGPCDDDVNAVMLKPYVKKQLDTLDPATLAKELKEYGAWDDTELANHKDNLQRWVWISAGDIDERRFA